MEVRTDPWPSRRGNGPHPVGWPVQRIHSLACEAAAPVCFGQGFASLASGVPWNRCHPLKRETLTVSPDHGSTCATNSVAGHGLAGSSETIRHTKCILVSPIMWQWRYGTRESNVVMASCDTQKYRPNRNPSTTGTAGRAPAGADSVPYHEGAYGT